MRVFVVGGGAREHALVWKLHFSPQVSAIYAAPGNAGISFLARTAPVPADDIQGLLRLAIENRIDLTIVGPEAPLAAGIVDAFHEAGLRIFGPTQAAARIEWSKAWAKDLMRRYDIPAGRWATAETVEDARAAIKDFGIPVVVKADGLARGHGAVVCRTAEQAEATLDDFMVKGIHGASGKRVVIEEFLKGVELSAFALSDGAHVLPLIGARDYKPLLDGDEGPNTGGMGGYTRPAYATAELMDEVHRGILKPAIDALAAEGTPYVGVLYAGLMITPNGPRVLEFNCRWGDPEAQLLLPLLKTDLVELMVACLDGQIDKMHVEWHEGTSVGVALATAGYPSDPRKGDPIMGLDEVDEGILVFHAATRVAPPQKARSGWFRRPRDPGKDGGAALLTDGGRVLTVVATGANLPEARSRAYVNVERIRFEGMQYRRDLGALDPQLSGVSRWGSEVRGEGSGVGSQVSGFGFEVSGEPDTRRPTPDTQSTPNPQPTPLSPQPSVLSPQSSCVAILMGSESDRSVMEETAKTLESLGISHEVHVMSAHRTPERVRAFARGAEARGVRVIVAGAGGAAHLPGVIAAQTTLPVIGVPMPGTSLMGLDSLLSIVQMPAGIPVATVALGAAGARNAAYLAAAILGLGDDDVRERYKRFRAEQSGGELA